MNTPNKLPFPLTPPFAILGYGVEGKYALEFLQRHDLGPITLIDQKKMEGAPHDIPWQMPENGWGDLTHFGTIFRSPGVHYSAPEIEAARNAGVKITSLTELTFEYARNHITAITGSNGKTTTTNLTAHLLKTHYGEKIILGGNDHDPVLQQVLDRPIDPVVMEVSSFQFADLAVSPHIAAILNLTPNHLDWHDDLEDYAHAKRNLILHQKKQDWAVLNANDENTRKFGEHVKGNLMWIGQEKGEYWVTWREGVLVAHFNGVEREILKKEEIALKTHPDNLAFATGIALIHGLQNQDIKKGLQSFPGTEHRLEYLGEKDGIKFYNDSACTTPESAQVAIEQFEDGKLILLLGGSSKNSEFDYLAADIKKHQARVVLYGEEAGKIGESMKAQGAEDLILNKDYSSSFEEIIHLAFKKAQAGDNVVLSPACASFDMFKNSKERGKQFKEVVKRMIDDL